MLTADLDAHEVTDLVASTMRAVHRDRLASISRATELDWPDPGSFRRWREVTRGVRVTVLAPGTIAVVAPDTAEGRTWGHVAADVAADCFDILDGADLRSVVVHRLSSTSYVLTFTITGDE